jgi:hypothetical protein
VTGRVLTLIVLLSAATAYAQQVPPITNEPDFRLVQVGEVRLVQAGEVPQPPDPPAGDAAWSLTIHTTGGFTGQGVGSVTVISDGSLMCGSGCAAQVAASRLRPVFTALASIVDAAWIRKMPSSFCRDCVQTTVVLKRREGDAVRTYVASWDDSQPATSELRELRRLVFELRSAR